MLLEIKTELGSLDLPDGADRDFYITKQLRDVHELDTREGDFSKTLILPYTAHNIRLIGAQTPLLTRHRDQGTQFIPVEVLMSGFPVIDGAIMRIESGDSENFTVTFFGGVVGFFVQLSDAGINTLNWTGANYNFDWNVAALVARRNVAVGADNIVYPNAIWHSNASLQDFDRQGGDADIAGVNDLSVPNSGFFVYFKTVMDKIFANLEGLTVDYSDLEKEDRFNRLAFACKMPFIRESYKLPDTGNFRGLSSATVAPLLGGAQFKSLQIATLESNINISNNEWIVPSRGVYRHNTQILSDAIGTFSVSVALMRNNSLVKNYQLSQGSRTTINDSIDIDAETNDRIWVQVQSSGVVGTPLSPSLVISLNLQKSSARDVSINVQDYLPNVSQRDFVRGVLNMFNIIPVQKQGQVTLKLWDKIPEANPIEIDVDLENNVIESGLWAGYAARNHLRYADSPLVQRDDQNASFDVTVAGVDAELTKIELPFSALDNTVAASSGGQLIRSGVPSLDFDYEVQDNQITFNTGNATFNTVDNHKLKVGDILLTALSRMVVLQASGKTGAIDAITETQTPSFASIRYKEANTAPMHIALMNDANGTFRIRDGSVLSQTAGDFKNAVFDNSLIWSTLMDNYFRNLINAVSNPFKLEAWFDLSILQFVSIDQTEPFYIPSYGALFYVNVIEQFKSIGKVRIELLQIGSATNVVAEDEVLQVGAFDDSFSNAFDNYDSSEI